MGSLANGAILRANPRTGDIKVIAEGAPGSMTVGVDYDRHRDLLWAAGGGPPTNSSREIRAYDADSGDLLATYTFPEPADWFINDLVVKRRAVYATDSRNREAPGRAAPAPRGLPGQEAASILPLTGDFDIQAGTGLNGIVAAGRRLIAIQGGEVGLLFRINPRTGVTRTIDLDGDRLINGDGLERDGDILYVVQNRSNAGRRGRVRGPVRGRRGGGRAERRRLRRPDDGRPARRLPVPAERPLRHRERPAGRRSTGSRASTPSTTEGTSRAG